MVRGKHSGAFWFFLLLLAVGAGWVVHQDWRWPLPWLADRASETDAQAPAPDAVAERPAAEQAPPEQPAPEDPIVGVAPAEPVPAEPADTQVEAAETEPRATDGQGLGTEASPETPQPVVSDTTGPPPEPGPLSTDAEVAALEPSATDGETERAAPAEAAVSGPLEVSPEPEPADGLPAGGETEGAAAPSTVATGDLPPDPNAEAGSGPSFDIVRVGRDGRAVIAGRAAPGAEVEVRAGGQVIDRVHATRRGEWVAIPARPLAPGDQELTALASQGDTALESRQVVVVAVPQPTSPVAATTEASAPAAPAEPVAVLLPRDRRGTGRILQAPGRLSAEGTLALMTVSYDESGEVLLSGEAPPGVPVRIYVDNRPAALVVGDAKGDWSSGLGEALEPGTYTLRLDQLDADGQAVARIETPFTRVSEPPVEGDLQVDYVVVQPGNSLWRIARRLSGKGLDYVHIYGANQLQIRDPDLIYPGQVFEIPVQIDAAG